MADVAASRRSSHLLLWATAAGPYGSAESAFLPSILSRLPYSIDLLRSCLGFRLFWVIEDFRGLGGLSFLCNGGNVEDLPGGERAMIEGSSSRGRGDWKGGILSGCAWFWIGGNSTEEDCVCGLRSFSEMYPFIMP